MEGQCHLCGSSRNVDMCNCPKDPIPLCEKCCDKHEFAHGRLTITKEVEAYCTFDEFPAIQICIACMSNLCEKCCKGHAMQCGEIDLYPIELTELVVKGDEGISRLKRGKNIDRTIESLREMLGQISERTKSDVESQFVVALEALETAKSQTFSRVDELIAKLSEDIDALEARLNPIKYEDFTPFVRLEVLLLSESHESILSRFASEQWFEVIINQRMLSQLSSDLLSISRATLLFSEPQSACSWVNRYALLMGEKTQMCDLATMELFEPSFHFLISANSVWLQLSSGEYFICGGFTPQCYLIDINYNDKQQFGALAIPRCRPGIVLYNDFIYVFGGRTADNSSATSTIQRFEMQTRRAVVLKSELTYERVCTTPCLLNGRIYLIGGVECSGVEVFDLENEAITFIPVQLPNSGPSIVFPYRENKLMVMCCFQSIFDTEKQTISTFSYDEEVFLSGLCPLLYQGKYYFTVYRNKEKAFRLAYMAENSTILQFTDVTFR